MTEIRRTVIYQKVTIKDLRIGDYFEILGVEGLLRVTYIHKKEKRVSAYYYNENRIINLSCKHRTVRCSNVIIKYDVEDD